MSTSQFYLPEGLPAPAPAPDGLDKPFWEGLQVNKLIVQRCKACKTFQWGPEWVCHKCHSFDIGWEEVAQTGVIYSWERAWHPVHPALKDHGPYIVVLVELPHAGNIRMIGNLLGDPKQDIRIGGTVEAVFEHHTGSKMPYTLAHWRVTK